MPGVNWGAVQDQSFEPLSADDVRVPLDAVMSGFDVRAGKEFPYFSFEFTLDGEAAAAHGNRKFWETASTDPKALFALKRIFLALGIAAERVSEGSDEDPEVLAAESVGASCRLKLTPPKSYPKNDGTQGIRNDVQSVLAPAYAVPANA